MIEINAFLEHTYQFYSYNWNFFCYKMFVYRLTVSLFDHFRWIFTQSLWQCILGLASLQIMLLSN